MSHCSAPFCKKCDMLLLPQRVTGHTLVYHTPHQTMTFKLKQEAQEIVTPSIHRTTRK